MTAIYPIACPICKYQPCSLVLLDFHDQRPEYEDMLRKHYQTMARNHELLCETNTDLVQRLEKAIRTVDGQKTKTFWERPLAWCSIL